MNPFTISIVSHGHAQLLRELLGDLGCMESARGATVVLTLNKADEPFDASAFPSLRIQVIRNPEPRGFSANHNAAFKRCETPWFVVLNPDLRMPFDVFPSLMSVAVRDHRIGLVAPLVLNAVGEVEDSVRTNLTPLSLLKRHALRRDTQGWSGTSFRWFAGMFLLLRSSAFQQVGGFDERFFLYCEDYDLCARMHLAGHQLVQDVESHVVHRARRDSRRSMQHLRWHLGSLLRVWRSKAFLRITYADLLSRRERIR